MRSAAVVLVLSGCGAGSSAVCVTNDVGRVCADVSNGVIEFSGRGLEPGSDVRFVSHDANTDPRPIVMRVGTDGSFEPDGRGVISMFADTEFTFAVSAIDAKGESIEGDIVITN